MAGGHALTIFAFSIFYSSIYLKKNSRSVGFITVTGEESNERWTWLWAKYIQKLCVGRSHAEAEFNGRAVQTAHSLSLIDCAENIALPRQFSSDAYLWGWGHVLLWYLACSVRMLFLSAAKLKASQWHAGHSNNLIKFNFAEDDARFGFR